MEDKNFSGDENDILNQSYENICSINENNNAIEKLDDGGVYGEYGLQNLIKLACDKNGNKIGIAIGIRDNGQEMTHNCLNYAFLASCGERVPHILSNFKKDNVSEGYISSFEVQKFFPHDGRNNYFSPNTGDSYPYVPYKGNMDYERRKELGFMIEDLTKEVTITPKALIMGAYRTYLRAYHILTECDKEFKTEFIDHFATLFADELCFDIQDRNRGNILVTPSKNGNGRDIVNIDVDFGWQKEITSGFYSALYLILKNVTFSFGKDIKKQGIVDMNSELTEKYTARGDKVHFQFQQEQKLKISPGIIAEIDKKIIEKIEQRLNFRKDKFLQYYIDNCIRRGDIDKQVAFSDFQTFMKSLYEYLKKQAESLKKNKDFDYFCGPFNDFMKKNKDYQSFNNLSEGDFNKKWDERARVLKNPKKIEEKKVDPIINEKIIDDTKGKKENEIKKEDENDIKDESEIKKENININEEEKKEANNDLFSKKNCVVKPIKRNKLFSDYLNLNSVHLLGKKETNKNINEIEIKEKGDSNISISKEDKKENKEGNKTEIEIKTEDKKEDKKEEENDIKDENKIKKENKTSGIYLIKLLLIIVGPLLIAGGIALFFTASALVLKFFAVGLLILGAVGFGIGLFYNKIGDYYRAKPGSCCISFLTYIILEPKEKNKETNINPEKEKDNFINEDKNVL